MRKIGTQKPNIRGLHSREDMPAHRGAADFNYFVTIFECCRIKYPAKSPSLFCICSPGFHLMQAHLHFIPRYKYATTCGVGSKECESETACRTGRYRENKLGSSANLVEEI